MSTARPDSSRRREPKRPGRRIGASTRDTRTTASLTPSLHRIPSFSFAPALSLLATAALSLALAAPVLADEDEGPVVLTNADVHRLHAKEAAANPKAGRTAAPAAATEAAPSDAEPTLDAAEIAANRALEESLRKKLDLISRQSMGSVARTLDARALGSDDASALPDLQGTPDAPVTETVPAAPAPVSAEGEPSARLRNADPVPACIYGPRGRLIHAPDGLECAPIRTGGASKYFDTETREKTARARERQVGCVYGSRGQLLYSSPGVECAG